MEGGEVAWDNGLHVILTNREMRALCLVAPIVILIAPFGVASGGDGIAATSIVRGHRLIIKSIVSVKRISIGVGVYLKNPSIGIDL